MGYYDIYMTVKDDCKEGYSVFVKADSPNEAVEVMTNEHLYEEAEDLDHIEAITEITEEEYLAAQKQDLIGSKMKRIEKTLNDIGIKHEITENNALIEFWTDTAGQDIPVEFEYDGTANDFVEKFSDCAESYDVDEEVALYAGMRGANGIPTSIRTLIDDCQEAKDTLMHLAGALKAVINNQKTKEFLSGWKNGKCPYCGASRPPLFDNYCSNCGKKIENTEAGNAGEYGIKIAYSWGDEEDINQYGTFATEEEAFQKACELAGKEAYVQNEEFLEEKTCTVFFDAANKGIDLRYDHDDTWCYYRVEKVES